jgi:radical SAM-linked protein
MTAGQPPVRTLPSPQARRTRVGIQFSVEGDLCFLSHRDELRMLTRALTRSGWPLAYSEGFNPQPRVTLPLPRSVGMASACEWAIVELDEDRAVESLHRSLATQLPPACHLDRVFPVPTRAKPHARRAVYCVELQPEHAAQAERQLAQLLAAKTLTVERTHGPDRPAARVDIRPYIETLSLEGRTLSMRLGFTDGRSARPVEILTALGLPPGEYNHRVRRVQVEWDIELGGPEPRPPSAERNNLAQAETQHTQARERDAPKEG